MAHITFPLVGASFRPIEAQLAVRDLVPGDDLELEAEPTNQYDPNAIRVIFDGLHIGYVPAKQNDFDVESVIACRVQSAHPKKPLIHVEIDDGEDA